MKEKSMPKVEFPYGRGYLSCEIPQERFVGCLEADINKYVPLKSEMELVQEALHNPIASETLKELAKRKNKIVLLASDHTRPVPSKVIVPLMLKEIREGNPQAEITILIATGCHRSMTQKEIEEKFGKEIATQEKILIHNCDDTQNLVKVGVLPSGGELVVNRVAAEADLLVAEGFIEPHFFAGFSGGRKSVLPGIAARKTVMFNHNARFIADGFSRTGVLEENLIHKDMVYAAEKVNLRFICNVVLNSQKQIIYAVAGSAIKAHREGCEFLRKHCSVKKRLSDIVITTNGGYPLDQNVYQAVKGMTTAEATVKDNGIIIMLAEAEDGCGGEKFYQTFCKEKDLDKLMQKFVDTPPESTVQDQWQSQILIRILKKCKIILVSSVSENIVRNFHMIPAKSLEEAIQIADNIWKKHFDGKAGILCIPDGVSMIIE